jgi:hypothetical protein
MKVTLTFMKAEPKKFLKGKVMKKVNWINGFDAGNKKEKYYLEFRLGTITILELKWEKSRFRFMLFNLGFEI